MSERDYLAKEEALKRLSEPEGDHELHTALERMRVEHPHLLGCAPQAAPRTRRLQARGVAKGAAR